jgi:hypothetical protein
VSGTASEQRWNKCLRRSPAVSCEGRGGRNSITDYYEPVGPIPDTSKKQLLLLDNVVWVESISINDYLESRKGADTIADLVGFNPCGPDPASPELNGWTVGPEPLVSP